jgi:hypothetical protein
MATARSILLNVGVFLADNHVRRSTGSYTFNYTSQNGNTTLDYVTVPENGGIYTMSTPLSMNPNQLTLIVVNGGTVTASVTLRNSTSYNVRVTQLHVVDDDVQSIVFTNNGTNPVRLILQQI